MIRVTAIHLVPSTSTLHEHIQSVQWINTGTGVTGQSTKSAMVEYINSGGSVIVSDGIRAIDVGVVSAPTPYIRTRADGVWTDNLLALPKY